MDHEGKAVGCRPGGIAGGSPSSAPSPADPFRLNRPNPLGLPPTESGTGKYQKKLESATARIQEDKGKTPTSNSTPDKPKDNPGIAALMEKISQTKLPAWAAMEKSPTALRILPGVGLPAGNEGFTAFGSLAPQLAGLDSTSTLELIGRAEPGNDAWETAQERAHRLLSSAEKSLKGQTGRIRLRIEVLKGPRMEWRIVPADPAPSANPESKPAHK